MRKITKPVFFIVLFLILGFAYLTYAGIHHYYGDIRHSYIKGVDEIRWGIDIQGGVNATFEPDLDGEDQETTDGMDAVNEKDITNDDMDAAKAVIEQRLIGLNITVNNGYFEKIFNDTLFHIQIVLR